MIAIEFRKLRHLKIAPMVLGMLFLLCLFNIGSFGASRIKDLAAELSGIGMIQAFLVPILIALNAGLTGQALKDYMEG